MSDTLPTPEPVRAPGTEPYWAGAAEGRLVLPRCPACAEFVWYPRPWCPGCGAAEVDWVEVPGSGSVYTYSVIRRGGAAGYGDALPYVLASVELDEGPRVLTNIRTADPAEVRIGARVQAVFDPVGDTALLRFALDEERP